MANGVMQGTPTRAARGCSTKNMHFKTFLRFAFAASFLVICPLTEAEPVKEYSLDDADEIVKDFKTITLNDGISQSEANLLILLYFTRYDGVCGFPLPLERKGNWWISKTLVGPNGAADADIRVNAKFGHIFQRGRPTSIPPWEDLKTLLGGRTEADEK